MDLLETGSGLRVVCDLPGVSSDDVRVFIDKENVLHIQGEKKALPLPAEADAKEETVYHRMERLAEGTLKRLLKLPSDINIEKTTCTFKNSVLSVDLPRNESTEEAEDPPVHPVPMVEPQPSL